MRVDGVGQYTLLGETIDDAAGEAFDKSAVDGLAYPGGLHLARLAEQGRGDAYKLPRPLLHSGDLTFVCGPEDGGTVQAQRLVAAAGTDRFEALDAQVQADLAASTQAAIIEVLLKKSLAALKQTGLNRLVVAGGSEPTAACVRNSMPPAPSVRCGCTTPSCTCAPTTVP